MTRIYAVVCLVFAGLVLNANHDVTANETAASDYLGPVDVVASADGKQLFVAAQDAKQVLVVDVAKEKVTRKIPMPAPPTGLVLSPDGGMLYVTCTGPKSTIVAIDVATFETTTRILTGHTACGPAVSPDGKTLYVCLRFNNAVAVIDLTTCKETARVPVTREPVDAIVTADGKTVFIANLLPATAIESDEISCEITAIDTASRTTIAIPLPFISTSLRGLCISPGGKYLLAVHNLTRAPIYIGQDWMISAAVSVIDIAQRKRIGTIALDEKHHGAIDPSDGNFSKDGKSIFITCAGSRDIHAVDMAATIDKLLQLQIQNEAAKQKDASFVPVPAANVPDFLDGLRQRYHLRAGDGFADPWSSDASISRSPRRSVVLGSKIYTAAYFSDALVVLDTEAPVKEMVSAVRIGPKPTLTDRRLGEALFQDAGLLLGKIYSCTSCHPDGRADGINWDMMEDGLGNPKNTRSILLADRTPPSTASGIRKDAELMVRSRIFIIHYYSIPWETGDKVYEYLKSIEPVPSPYLVDGRLSESAERGKKLFFDEEVGCAKCHPAPLYTDLKMHNVASRAERDRRDTFDTPTLVECWRTAPYLHSGRYLTVKDLLTKGKHGQTGVKIEGAYRPKPSEGGNSGKLTEMQIDDLVEYVLSL